MTTADPTERALAGAAIRVLQRRAAALRERAANGTSTVERDGRVGTSVSPEARIAIGTAEVFERIAADLAGSPLDPSVAGAPINPLPRPSAPAHVAAALT